MARPISSRRLLLGGVLIALALFASGAHGTAFYCEPRYEPPRKPLKSVALDLPFYFFDRAGRFYRGNFGNDSQRPISDHGFRSSLNFTYIRASRSPEGRWIAYSGRLEPNDALQYWLYDKQTDTDRLLLETPKGTWNEERISPDGKHTAIIVISPVPLRGWKPRSAILQLIDNASGRTREVRFPGNIPMLNQIPIPWQRERQGYDIFWSRDAEQVLAYFRVDGKKGEAQDYYRLRLAKRKLERIDGRYDSERRRPVFLAGARPIPVDDRRMPLRSDQTYPRLRSPDGSRTAFIGYSRKGIYLGIFVRGPDGTTKELYRAGSDTCHGAYVIAWLDSRYFLYRNYRWSTYVGDARTGRSKNLFPDFKGPELFDW